MRIGEKMKTRLFAIVVALAILTSLTAKAANVNFEQVDETIGVILDYDNGYLQIHGDPLTPGGFFEATIDIGDAPIYNLLTGLPASVNSLVPGTQVRTAYFSHPDAAPQAVAIWLHPNHKNAAAFTITVSDNIQYGHGYCNFLSTDGRYRIILTDDTYILDPTYGPQAPEYIEPGQTMFVWVDVLTASSPALVYPEKVVTICQ